MRRIAARRDLAEAIRAARLEANLTQQQVADQIGVGRLLIVQIESGRANPTFDNLLRIATLLNMAFFFGEKPKPLVLSPLAQKLEEAAEKISRTGSYS